VDSDQHSFCPCLTLSGRWERHLCILETELDSQLASCKLEMLPLDYHSLVMTSKQPEKHSSLLEIACHLD
jgi:hypothetical protein